MFREMRRIKQILPPAECIALLQNATSGVLAVAGDDDYPYAVPMSFLYRDGKIIFHGASSGHKLDAIARHAKVSFCVTAMDDIRQAEYTTFFRSVIAFGRARVLDEPGEKRAAFTLLANRYFPEQLEKNASEVDQFIDKVTVVEIAIEHLSGKQSIELVTG